VTQNGIGDRRASLSPAAVIFTANIHVAPAHVAGSELLTKLFYLWVAG
jgi:hypothetical protein